MSPTLQADSLPAHPQRKPKNPGVASLSLLQHIFPALELNQGLLYCRRTLDQLGYQGSPNKDKKTLKSFKYYKALEEFFIWIKYTIIIEMQKIVTRKNFIIYHIFVKGEVNI